MGRHHTCGDLVHCARIAVGRDQDCRCASFVARHGLRDTLYLHLPANETSAGIAGDFWLLDLRICALDIDGKTKNAHFREMLVRQIVQDANPLCWQAEELHRGRKQLTGSEKCQCRTARLQRNYLACYYHAWLSLKVKALHLNKMLYQGQTDLLRDYLRAELRNPRIPAF
jgi:hypothetical protein